MRSPWSTKARSAGGLVGPAIVYALLSLAAAVRQRTGLARQQARLQGDHPDRTEFAPARGTESLQHLEDASRKQRGRGRRATVPWQIPWEGWKDIFWRTVHQVSEDRLLAVAAGVVFYGLLALFPTITAFVSLYGLFANPQAINEHLSLASGILPDSAVEIIREQVNRIAAKGGTSLSIASAFGLAVALWSANAGMKALIDALNVIYSEKEKRSFVKLNLEALALTAGAILAMLVAVAAIVVLPLVLSYVGLGGWTETLLRLSRWPALLFVVIFGLAVLYWFGPSREYPRWEWLSVGSIFAAVAWLGSSALFSWYLGNFANYEVCRTR